MRRIYTLAILICTFFLLAGCYSVDKTEAIDQGESENQPETSPRALRDLKLEKVEGVVFPVPETVDFSEIDFSEAAYICIYNSITGDEETIENPNDIAKITAFIQKISGSEPISSRGYYGGLYCVSIYWDDPSLEPFDIGFIGEDISDIGENGTFNYGIYEIQHGYTYPIKYQLSGVTTEEIMALFGSYFN